MMRTYPVRALCGALILLSACGQPTTRATSSPAAAPEAHSAKLVTPAQAPPTTSAAQDAAEAAAPTTAAEDLTTPVGTTGVRIGDPIPEEKPDWLVDGQVDPAKLPAWAGVGSNGRVVGYLKPYDVYFGETGDVVIYGEDGKPIGQFSNGVPVVEGGK